jgi:hypothetical protein
MLFHEPIEFEIPDDWSGRPLMRAAKRADALLELGDVDGQTGGGFGKMY